MGTHKTVLVLPSEPRCGCLRCLPLALALALVLLLFFCLILLADLFLYWILPFRPSLVFCKIAILSSPSFSCRPPIRFSPCFPAQQSFLLFPGTAITRPRLLLLIFLSVRSLDPCPLPVSRTLSEARNSNFLSSFANCASPSQKRCRLREDLSREDPKNVHSGARGKRI